MDNFLKWLQKTSNFLTASMLAVLFFTFLFQIFSAFSVRDKDHVTFDIFYFATPKKVQLIFSIISAIGIILIMGLSFLPTIDYIDWMKMRSTTTVKIPLIGKKIPLNIIFSVYGIFLISLIIRYVWKLFQLIRFGLPDKDRFSELEKK